MEATKTPLDIPELERLEPIHTKGLQRVFALLRVAVGGRSCGRSWTRRSRWDSPRAGSWMRRAPR